MKDSVGPGLNPELYVPLDKTLDRQSVESLFERGEPKVYQEDERNHAGMPCGGIGAVQVEVTGDPTRRFLRFTNASTVVSSSTRPRCRADTHGRLR